MWIFKASASRPLHLQVTSHWVLDDWVRCGISSEPKEGFIIILCLLYVVQLLLFG